MRKSLFLIALLGLIVSAYLSFEYILGGPIVCGIGGGGCDVVRASKYSHLFYIPVPLFGIAFYLALAVGALLINKATYKLIRWPITVMTGIGLAFSLWLSYLQEMVIHAWCTWCLASAFLSITAFYFVWHRMPRHARKHNLLNK